jgi:hypothetical protein
MKLFGRSTYDEQAAGFVEVVFPAVLSSAKGTSDLLGERVDFGRLPHASGMAC